jgi:hypothetical protein
MREMPQSGHIQIIRLHPLPSPCSGKVDESLLYIGPYKLNANSISDIKTFKSSYQLSLHRRLGETNRKMF